MYEYTKVCTFFQCKRLMNKDTLTGLDNIANEVVSVSLLTAVATELGDIQQQNTVLSGKIHFGFEHFLKRYLERKASCS